MIFVGGKVGRFLAIFKIKTYFQFINFVCFLSSQQKDFYGLILLVL